MPIRDTPPQKILINNKNDANKGKIKRYLNVEISLVFVKLSKR